VTKRRRQLWLVPVIIGVLSLDSSRMLTNEADLSIFGRTSVEVDSDFDDAFLTVFAAGYRL